jgi:hypothetical protein
MSLFPIPVVVPRQDFVKNCATVFVLNGASNTSYFERVFDTFQKGKFVAWNWAAFALGMVGFAPFWLIVKRLYLHAFVVFLSTTVLFSFFYTPGQSIQELAIEAGAFVLLWNTFISIMLGAFGNYLQYWWMQKWTQKYAKLNVTYPYGLDFNIVNAWLLTQIFSMYLGQPLLHLVFVLTLLIGSHWYWFEKPVKTK